MELLPKTKRENEMRILRQKQKKPAQTFIFWNCCAGYRVGKTESYLPGGIIHTIPFQTTNWFGCIFV
jgi:hypothetical protein